MASTSEPIIDIQHLRKSFGSFQAVNDLSFSVYEGDVFGFLGPNGAGKSTTIRCMTSLIRPDSGSIKLFGQDLHRHRASVLARVGCIIEKPDFYKYLSAEANLWQAARMSGHAVSRARIQEILDFVGLRGREHDKVKGYSQGMKQRLGLAQALLHDPDVLILDEPTNGLDPQGIVELRELILRLRDEHSKTIVISSHQLSEIELIANRMIIINKGQSVAEGAVNSLLQSDDLHIVVEVDRPDNALRIVQQHLPEAAPKLHGERSLELDLHKDRIPHMIRVLSDAGIQMYGVESRRKLEDFFISMVNS